MRKVGGTGKDFVWLVGVGGGYVRAYKQHVIINYEVGKASFLVEKTYFEY